MNHKEAKKAGAKRYFNGVPCVNGHLAERLVSTRSCIVCERARRDKWAEKNKDRVRETLKRWAKNNVEKRRANSRKRRTGFSTELFNATLKLQNNQCYICRKQFGKEFKNRPNADHCHNTKTPRGILCYKCNFLLGTLKDDVVFIQNMLSYLIDPPAKRANV